MKLKEFFRKLTSRYLMFHLLAMILFIITLCMGVKYGLNIYTHHGEGVEVPNLTGVDFNRAIDMLGDEGLGICVTDSSYNKRLPANSILTQQPGAGTMVKEGRMIFVTINSASLPEVRIPDLIDNSSYRQAQAQLTALGFKMLEPKRVDGEKDWVYGIIHEGRNLQTGDMVPKESKLTLVVGNGYEEEEDEDMMLDVPEGAEESSEVDDFEEVTVP
jgi:beta-lactam-binding protein with PASTA domain